MLLFFILACACKVFFFFFFFLLSTLRNPPPPPTPTYGKYNSKYARFHWLAVWRCPQGGCYSRGCTLRSAAVRGSISLKGTSHNSHLGTWCTYHWYMYSWLPIKQTLANSNQSRFPLDYFHTFTLILPSVTQTSLELKVIFVPFRLFVSR